MGFSQNPVRHGLLSIHSFSGQTISSVSARALRRTPATNLRPSTTSIHNFHSTAFKPAADPVLNSETISKITEAEKKITGSDQPVKGGPTAQAQSHAGEPINSQTLRDITKGEKKLTGGERVKGGPTATAQSILSQGRNDDPPVPNPSDSPATGSLDRETISKITEAEKQITGSDEPIKDGPTAQAQKHAGQPTTSESLHDITEGEKKITGKQQPVAGGPTATAQRELARSRR